MVKTFPPQNEFVLDLVVEKVNNQQFINIMLDISKELEYEDISYFSTDTIEVISDSLITWSLKIPDEGLSISKQEKLSRIQDLPSLQGVHYGPFYDYEIDTNCNSEGHYHDYLAVEFEQLDKIRDFSSYIKDEFGVSMNMETLIQRENYLFVGNLAIAAILMVIVFSIFSLTLYISETFKNHILKVKKNLGNLMALGASNNELISLYLRVAFRMLLYAILIAFAIGYVSGELFEKYILGNLMVLQEGENYFSLLNSWLGLFIFLIISIALLMTFVTIKRILKVSPGDLIYERDHAKIEQNLKRNEGS
jgi:ABC-type antimicrobial peptide transport system permease subunit